MKITERQAKILNTIVKEYIDSAQPVASQLLEKKYDFGIRPAMIRIEMQKLTDKGFLLQPHTSSGRVPTDRAYRLFVDNLLEREISEFEDVFKVEEMFKEAREDILKWSSRLTKFLAEESSNFAMLSLLERDLAFKEGWEEVFEEPEFDEKNLIFDFAKLLEDFEENVEDLKINSGIKVYIGKESPFPKAKNFSIISSKCRLPDEEKAILTLLGPKRMDYNRNLSLIQSLNKFLERL